MQGIPWCFYPDNVPNPCVGDNVYNWEAADPGFTEAEYQTMYTNYEANLNIRGTGAIIAAPDEETPGGDYRYIEVRRIKVMENNFQGSTGCETRV